LSDHECKHEVDLALAKQWREDTTKKIDSLVEAILGNGKPGLKTEMELQKKESGRLWYAFYGCAVGVAGLGGYLLAHIME